MIVPTNPTTLEEALEWIRRVAAEMVIGGQNFTGASVVGGGVSGSGELVGAIRAWPSSTLPVDWLRCDGALLTEVDFPDLYYVLGHQWDIGGEPSGGFRIPDLRGKFLVDGETIGQMVGQAQMTLAPENLPEVSLELDEISHGHGLTPASHSHTIDRRSWSIQTQQATVLEGTGTEKTFLTGASLSNAADNVQSSSVGLAVDDATLHPTGRLPGSSAPFDLSPPAGVIQWIIKVR